MAAECPGEMDELVGGLTSLDLLTSEMFAGEDVTPKASAYAAAYEAYQLMGYDPSSASSIAMYVHEYASADSKFLDPTTYFADSMRAQITRGLAAAAMTSVIDNAPMELFESFSAVTAPFAIGGLVYSGVRVGITAGRATVGLGRNSWRAVAGFGARFGEGLTMGVPAYGGFYGMPQIIQIFKAGRYAVVTAGKHHLMPRALGNYLRYGSKSLTSLGTESHTVLQGALNEHLAGLSKMVNGKIVSMRPGAGNPGALVRRVFSLDDRVKAADDFYRTFQGGRYYPAFRMELNAARKAGALK